MSYSFDNKATDFKLTDPALLDLLDAHHARLRFPEFSANIAFQLGLALREEFISRYGDEESGRKAMEGVKEGLGEFIGNVTRRGR